MYGAMLERADIVLLQVLLRDSRATAQQIAEVTGLPPAYIPDMMASMREADIIGDLTTKPSLSSLNARSVLVFGRSRLGSLSDARSALEHNDNVAWLAMASGGMLYLALHLREDADTETEVARSAAEAMMVRATAMTRDLFDQGLGRHIYTPDDMRILRAMNRNANRDLGEVAKETGISVSKVRSRFDEMTRRGALDFSVDFFPDNCDNLLTMLRLEVVETRGLEEKVGWLMGTNAPYILFFNTFSDRPSTFTSMILPETMGGLRAIMRSYVDSGAFGQVEADLLVESSILPTWRDRMLQD